MNVTAAGWVASADLVVVGSGVAGLTCALDTAELGLSVLVVTKDVVASGSTQWAQGGIAAALSPEDSPEDHLKDTLVAGAVSLDHSGTQWTVHSGGTPVGSLRSFAATMPYQPRPALQRVTDRRLHYRWTNMTLSGAPAAR